MNSETNERHIGKLIKRLATLVVVIAAAWMLGQLLGPAIVKALFR